MPSGRLTAAASAAPTTRARPVSSMTYCIFAGSDSPQEFPTGRTARASTLASAPGWRGSTTRPLVTTATFSARATTSPGRAAPSGTSASASSRTAPRSSEAVSHGVRSSTRRHRRRPRATVTSDTTTGGALPTPTVRTAGLIVMRTG